MKKLTVLLIALTFTTTPLIANACGGGSEKKSTADHQEKNSQQ